MRWCLLFSLCVLVCPGGSLAAQDKPPRVFALQYGKSLFGARFMFARKMKRRALPFAWLFYLIQTDKKLILVDTGFTQKHSIRRFGIKDYKHPRWLLSQRKWTPAQITDVILTHHHFDHAGGVHLFPKARLHMHAYTARVLRWSRSMPKVQKAMIRARREKRLRLFQKQKEITTGVRVEWVGGHTRGSAVVHVALGKRKVILVGDECYLQKACWRGWHLPGRSASNIKRNRLFLRRFQKGKGPLPLTAHDPRIMVKYRKKNKYVVEVVP